MIPVIIIVVGIKMVFGGFNKTGDKIKALKAAGENKKTGCAVFSGSDVIFDNEAFEGAELTAVFGGIKCDLRKAIIEKDTVIEATAVFGGIDILVPDTVNVKVSSTSIFGGVSNKSTARADVPTLYVSATCLFGGVDVK